MGARGVLMDITERRKAVEVLRASEENFRVVVENASDAILVEAGEGSHVYANQQAAEITGYCVAELLKTTIKDLAHPDEFEKIMQIYRRRLEGEPVPRLYETTIIRKDGKSVPIEVAGTKTVWQGKTADMVFFRDITDRKRAEEALRESEERFRRLSEAPFEGIVFHEEGKIIDANEAFATMFGYGLSEVIGRNALDFATPELREVALGHIRDGSEEPYDGVATRKDGSTFLIEARGKNTPYKGRTIRLTAVRDITDRKRAEEERERLLADLEAKNKELESFVYTISHDLKAPLVSLNGFSGALQKGYESQLGEEGRHYLERIQANVAHMEALIKSLLELSRIGQVVGAIEEIDVGPLLREIRDALAVRLKEAGAEFVVQEPLPTVCADRGRIYQVFVNLIDNAVKFRSAERALRIEVGCRQESGFFRFHVADNGIGIAPQYHEQIFAPFRKLHPEIEGVGIGLALVKKIVEHHGGRAWVENPSAEFTPSKPEGPGTGNEGAGVTFYFTLPIEHGVELLSRSSNLKGLS